MADTGAAYQNYLGIDIAAETFAAAWAAPGGVGASPVTFAQTPLGFAALQRRLQATAVLSAATLVVLEATGNYWVALALALHEAGCRVAVINPISIKLTVRGRGPGGVGRWRARPGAD
jgi:transposase